MISAARGPHNPYAPKVIAEQKAALDEEGARRWRGCRGENLAGDDEGGEEMARLQWWPGNCGGGGATLGFHGRGRTLGFAQIGSNR